MPEHPDTPTKPTRNAGATNACPNAEVPETESDREEDLGAKKTRPPRHVLKYVVVKCWVTGERAEMDEDQIRSELEAEMRHLMELSGQRKFFGHETLPTDIWFWKLGSDHEDRRCIRYVVHRCPMRHWCQCKVSCRVVTRPDFIELQRHGLHDKDSHDNDRAKKLKYDHRL